MKEHAVVAEGYEIDETLSPSMIGMFVELAAPGVVRLATGSAMELGVLWVMDQDSETRGTVVQSGNVLVRAGETITAGDSVESGPDGRAVVGRPRCLAMTDAAEDEMVMVAIAAPTTTKRDHLAGGREQGLFFHATALLIHTERALTLTDEWEELGGIVTNPAFFPRSLASSFCQMSGMAKSVGTGAQFRLVQEAPGDPVVFGPWDVGDTSDAWLVCVRATNPGDPVAFGGTSLLRVEGRLNGATSAALKYLSVSLLEHLG